MKRSKWLTIIPWKVARRVSLPVPCGGGDFVVRGGNAPLTLRGKGTIGWVPSLGDAEGGGDLEFIEGELRPHAFGGLLKMVETIINELALYAQIL